MSGLIRIWQSDGYNPGVNRESSDYYEVSLTGEYYPKVPWLAVSFIHAYKGNNH